MTPHVCVVLAGYMATRLSGEAHRCELEPIEHPRLWQTGLWAGTTLRQRADIAHCLKQWLAPPARQDEHNSNKPLRFSHGSVTLQVSSVQSESNRRNHSLVSSR